MRPLPFSGNSLIIIALVYVGVFLSLAGNTALWARQDQLSFMVIDELGYEVSAAHVEYVFPNQFVVREARAHHRLLEEEMLYVPVAVVFVDLWHSLQERQLEIQKVHTFNMDVTPAMADEIKAHGRDMVAYFRQFPQGRVNLIATGAHYWEEPADQQLPKQFDVNVLLDGHKMYSAAWFKSPEPIKIIFDVTFNEGDVLLDKIVFLSPYVAVNMWGYAHQGQANIKGYALFNKGNDRLRGLISGLGSVEEIVKADYRVFDIDGQLTFDLARVDIGRLKFSINDLLFDVKGGASWNKGFAYGLDFRGQTVKGDDSLTDHIQNLQFVIEGQEKGAGLRHNGYLDIVYTDSLTEDLPVKDLRLDFEGLHIAYDPSEDLLIMFDQGRLKAMIRDWRRSVELERINVRVNPKEPQRMLIALNADLYEGQLNGQLKADVRKWPFTVGGTFNFDHIDVNRLSGLAKDLKKVNGWGYGELKLNHAPGLSVKGQVAIKDGALHDFSVLGWLAKYFGIETLNDIAFDELSAQVAWDKQQLKVDDIAMIASQLNIVGRHQLDHKDFLVSDFSLVFPRATLMTSAQLKPLLNRMKEQVGPMVFEIKLSGRAEAVNFQWVTTDSKDSIQNAIPNFIQHKIERNVESSIDQQSKQ